MSLLTRKVRDLVADIPRELKDLLLKWENELIEAHDAPYTYFEDIDVTFTTTDVEQRISLSTLNRIPTGYTIVSMDNPCIVYDGGSIWGLGYLYLRAEFAGSDPTVKIRVT